MTSEGRVQILAGQLIDNGAAARSVQTAAAQRERLTEGPGCAILGPVTPQRTERIGERKH